MSTVALAKVEGTGRRILPTVYCQLPTYSLFFIKDRQKNVTFPGDSRKTFHKHFLTAQCRPTQDAGDAFPGRLFLLIHFYFNNNFPHGRVLTIPEPGAVGILRKEDKELPGSGKAVFSSADSEKFNVA